ncbi:MAG: alpha-ketoacid dehydrogenase subunit beta [Aeromicrobium sp.]
MTEMTFAKALNAGLRAAMSADDRVILMGEDIGQLGGVFRITDGLQAEFGRQRVRDTPLAESGIVGTAIGLAHAGFRPIVEIQFDGFVYPGYDQIVAQLARQFGRSHGSLRVPVVIRIPYGGGIGAVEHHSESPEAQFVLTPGLKVVTPSTPQDGFWMIQQAIAADDPVIFLEPKRRYWQMGEVDFDAAPPSLWSSAVRREGNDATLITYGPAVATCLEAAEAAEVDGMDLAVIDLRSLSPMDLEPVYASVRRTGRAVVVHEAARTLGLGAEIAARVTQECFYSLEAPVQRVTGYDLPYPPSRVEDEYLPGLDRILDTVEALLNDTWQTLPLKETGAWGWAG